MASATGTFPALRTRASSASWRRPSPRSSRSSGPTRRLARTLFFVFLVYFVVVATGQQSLLTGTTRNLPIVLVTALVETARIATLFLLPVWVVFFWRGRAEAWQPVRLGRSSGRLGRAGDQGRRPCRSGQRRRPPPGCNRLRGAGFRRPDSRSITTCSAAGSRSSSTTPWQAGVGAINALIVVAAADDNAEERAAPGWVYGTLNLVLVSGWMIVHLVLGERHPSLHPRRYYPARRLRGGRRMLPSLQSH